VNKKIIIICGGGESSVFVFNALSKTFKISKVIIEEKVSRKKFLIKRIKRLGLIRVLGQILFQVFVPRILKFFSKKRMQEIKKSYDFDQKSIPQSLIDKVSSVNSIESINLINKVKPDLIIVNGTRIISKEVIKKSKSIFINTHAGITPKYRGVHGGYWSLVNDDIKNFGVTVHRIDAGIDTGGILLQKNFLPSKHDNFSTYSYLQLGEGILLLKKVIKDLIKNPLMNTSDNNLESKLWSHPTIWTYLYHRIFRGIK